MGLPSRVPQIGAGGEKMHGKPQGIAVAVASTETGRRDCSIICINSQYLCTGTQDSFPIDLFKTGSINNQ